MILPSYVNGSWWTPASEEGATEVRDASTGEVVARVSTQGLDLAGALEYARSVGQRSLGELTFHQRAVILKQLAQVLTERKEKLYELSARTGATRTDSWIDIDGGIGVLFTYSSKGRRELPNSQVYVDGPVEQLSKDGSFLGRHIYTRLPGVAVQINAFNFPVWGSLEKFAPAFLAGVPTLVKPATPSGYLAEAMVRVMVESGLLPAGSLQLVSGSVPTLLTTFAWAIWSPSPVRPRLPSGCAPTMRCRPGACCSRPRPTRSTPRCSGRMRPRAPRSSTRTSAAS
jgi:oxepin-CoA hydrolase/3-oxo-5,6-dehydrosuberyl-CoA semialdehyde dehydrogenase